MKKSPFFTLLEGSRRPIPWREGNVTLSPGLIDPPRGKTLGKCCREQKGKRDESANEALTPRIGKKQRVHTEQLELNLQRGEEKDPVGTVGFSHREGEYHLVPEA